MIKSATEKLLNKTELDSPESKEMFKKIFEEIFTGNIDEKEALAFFNALNYNELSSEIIALAVDCANKTFKNYPVISLENSLNSVVFDINQDNKNYLDISLAVDIIASANDLAVFKHSFYEPQKCENSFKVLSEMGINIKSFDDDSFKKTNFGYFYLNSEDTFLKYAKNAINENSLLYIIYKFLNPLNAKNIAIGVNSRKMADNTAQICLNLNYSNTISVSGADNLPFVSLEKETYIAEAWKNKIFTYVLSPDLLDLEFNNDDNLIMESTEQSAETILSVFKNKRKDSFYNAITMNAACVLYITKKAPSILDGLHLAQKTIDSNLAQEKVEQLKKLKN